MVAWAILTLLLVRDKSLAVIFSMPPNLATTRTGPPAFTPLPIGAGLSITIALLNLAVTVCKMVPSLRITLIMPFLAWWTAFCTDWATSLPCAIPVPTRPLPSPITTVARKLKRLPPLVTRETRSTDRVFCSNSAGARGAPPRLPPPKRRPPPPPRPPKPPLLLGRWPWLLGLLFTGFIV